MIRTKIQKTLPVNYQRVEYLESDGNQFIDTGVVFTKDVQVCFDYYTETSQNGDIIGTESSDLSGCYIMNFNDATGISYYYGIASEPYSYSFGEDTHLGQWYNISAGEIFREYGQKKIIAATADFSTNTQTLLLFKGTVPFVGRLKNISVYVDGVLVRNFVCCYNTITNEIGLFDMVTRQFFINQGTGTFVKGADVDNPKITDFNTNYREVEYISATGTQYIDTQLIPTSDFQLRCAINVNDNNMHMLGVYNKWGIDRGSSDPWFDYNGTSYWIMTGGKGLSYYNIDKNIIIRATTEKGLAKSGSTQAGGPYNPDYNYDQNKTIHLFNRNGAEGINWISKMIGDIYRCTFRDNYKLVGDFVPVYRIDDGKIGYYDTVTKSFFVNIGTGEFTRSQTEINSTDNQIFAPMIYKNRAAVKAPRLPLEYQEVEYIENTGVGNQYIDLGVYPDNETGYSMRISIYEDSGSWYDFMGAYSNVSGTTERIEMRFVKETVTIPIINENNEEVEETKVVFQVDYRFKTDTATGSWRFDKRFFSTEPLSLELNFNNDRKAKNGTQIANMTLATIAQKFDTSINLFAVNNLGTMGYQAKTHFKFYSLNVTQGTDLVNHFIPCYRKSDGVTGVYDIIGKTFHPKLGTGGEFLTGPEIY